MIAPGKRGTRVVAASLRVQLFGEVRAWRDTDAVQLGPAQQRAVFALLVLGDGRPVTRDMLVSALWGDDPPRHAATVIQKHVMHLRRSLDPDRPSRRPSEVLARSGDGYLLRLAAEDVDVLRFRRLVPAAREAHRSGDHDACCVAAEEALRLWQAAPVADLPLLAGHPLVAVLTDERWAVVAWFADAALRRGTPGDAVAVVEEGVAARPLDEPLHGWLIRLYAALGRRVDALGCYEQLRRRLVDELGVDPTPQLRELHQVVLRDEDPRPLPGAESVPPTAPTAGSLHQVPRQLPAAAAGFVGRREELDQLDKLLEAAGATRTVVISAVSGTAGVGKTTLAVYWARRAADRFPDGQLYVNLRGFDPGGTAATPGEVVRSFLDALQVPAQRVPPGLDAQTAMYRSLLADRRMLVLLDNARDVEQVRPLLPGASGCLVLVTSRNQLTGLIVSAGALLLPLDLLNADEARDLVAERLGLERIVAESAAVEEIVERCARLPLALAIVAARAAAKPRQPLAALAAELRHLDDRLDSLATGDPGTDVRSVFSWSYRQLSQPVARLFRLLGVHPGLDLSVSAAASLAGIPPARVRPMLAELVSAHLIIQRVPGRYALHDLLRAYASELAASCASDADLQAALRRLLDHYLQTAHRADAVLEPNRDAIELVAPLAGIVVDEFATASAATDWFSAEYQALMAAVRLAVDAGLDRHAWQLVWSMSPFFERHRGFRDAIALHWIALQAALRLGDLAAQARSRRLLGMAHALLGEPDEAQVHLDRALEVYRQLSDDTNQGHLHLALGHLLDRQGRQREALHQVEQALARYRAGGNRVWQAASLNNLGWCHVQLGEYETAVKYCEQSLRLYQELGYRPDEATTWDSLGVAYHHLGRHADAIAAHEEALALFREGGYRYYEARTLFRLGDTYHARGDSGGAQDCWRGALAIFTDLDHPDAEQVRARLDS
jgi:DNA-binding SARP family transcriptional activator/tetratricopeptide (TPR) repeat protein